MLLLHHAQLQAEGVRILTKQGPSDITWMHTQNKSTLHTHDKHVLPRLVHTSSDCSAGIAAHLDLEAAQLSELLLQLRFQTSALAGGGLN